MDEEPIVYALGKPAQKAVDVLARERAGLLAEVAAIGEAIAELARTYGRGFRTDACRWDFAWDDKGQIVLHCWAEEEKPASPSP